jgi:DNA invertase Pin-like site-specific DNA recombinase
MKRAIFYTSTETDDQQSTKNLDMQESELRNYFMNNDLLVIDCYNEILGQNFKPPKWKALIRYKKII